MQSVDVLFLVEHVARELDVATCLAAKLKMQFGIEAEVKSYYLNFERNLARYRPAVVVFPFFYGADDFHPTEYLNRWPEATMVNLAWEQILMKVDVGLKTPRDSAARQQVYYACWTPAYRDFLAEHGTPSDHLLLTGNPVMKLYDAPYRSYFETRSVLAKRHGLDQDSKWILFPESYQYAFMPDAQLQSLVETQNADAELLAQARDYSERCLRDLFAWLGDLRAKDDPVFIFRPRPPTAPKQPSRLLRDIVGSRPKNIAIIKSESVREWILAADHVISSHSTTLIEAAVAGKPIHLFSPEIIPPALTAEWHGLVPLLKDKEGFLHALRRHPVEENCGPLADWARGQFAGDDALDMIATSIAQLFRDGRQKNQARLAPHARATPSRILVEAMQKLRPRNRFDAFGSREVARRVSRWQRILADEAPGNA